MKHTLYKRTSLITFETLNMLRQSEWKLRLFFLMRIDGRRWNRSLCCYKWSLHWNVIFFFFSFFYFLLFSFFLFFLFLFLFLLLLLRFPCLQNAKGKKSCSFFFFLLFNKLIKNMFEKNVSFSLSNNQLINTYTI